MGGLFSKGGGKRSHEEVWRQESVFENRLQEGHADTWGGVTSYNLLDIQQVNMSFMQKSDLTNESVN